MGKFIYVFGEGARDKMLEMQYELLREDEQRHIYVFLNTGKREFSLDGVEFALSDTLTF